MTDTYSETEVIPPQAGERVMNRGDMQRPGALQTFREKGIVSGEDVMISQSRGGLRFENMMQMMEFAKMMALADIGVPKHLRGNPGACLRITLQADAWGFDPFAVADKSYGVNDRLSYESQLVHAVIERRAPLEKRLRMELRGEGPTRRCKVIGKLIGEPDPFEWEGPEIGMIKVKNSPEWSANPDKQLWYHASRDWARIYCPDVLLGVYTRDELDGSNFGPDRARDVASIASRVPEGQTERFDADGIAKTLQDAGGAPAQASAPPEPPKEEAASDDRKPSRRAPKPEAEPQEVVEEGRSPADLASGAKSPETGSEYAIWAEAWIGDPALLRVDALARWESERELRAKCKVTIKERKRLEAILHERFDGDGT